MIDAALLIAAKLLAGWLIADLLGGLVHWLEDRVLTEDMPILGLYVVAPNRRHHADPLAFTAGGIVARNGTTWGAAGLASLIWLLVAGPSLIWAAATLGGMVTSIVHFYTHRVPAAGTGLRALQDIGLIQSARQHAQHHRPPADRRYCVLTDWLNPLLDQFGLWTKLERLLRIAPERAS
jgi:ubiquitin-conjugating enzyme E2 variant